MWQALLAAAVAGSTGIVAKRLFKPGAADQPPKPYDNGDLGDQRTSDCDRGSEQQNGEDEKDGVFRFSSSASRSSRKKKGVLGRQAKKGARAERSPASEQRHGNARRLGVSLKRRKICWNVAGNRGGSCSSQDTSLFGWGLSVGMMCMMSLGDRLMGRLPLGGSLMGGSSLTGSPLEGSPHGQITTRGIASWADRHTGDLYSGDHLMGGRTMITIA